MTLGAKKMTLGAKTSVRPRSFVAVLLGKIESRAE